MDRVSVPLPGLNALIACMTQEEVATHFVSVPLPGLNALIVIGFNGVLKQPFVSVPLPGLNALIGLSQCQLRQKANRFSPVAGIKCADRPSSRTLTEQGL